MLEEDLAHESQAQPLAVLLRREERPEELGAGLGRDAGAGVLDDEELSRAVPLRPQRDRAVSANRLHRVLQDVHQHLLDLAAVDGDVFEAVAHVQAERDAAIFRHGLEERHDVLQDRDDVRGAALRGREANDVGEALHERPERVGPQEHGPEGRLEVLAVLLAELVLNLIAIELPPLRERPSDIPLLARRFVEEVSSRYGRRLGLAADVGFWLKEKAWPGNVRQLKHVIERAALVSGKDTLLAADFAATFEKESAEPKPKGALPEVGAMTLDEMERAMIEKSLKHHGGNVSRVADSLGLSRAALYRRLEKYGIRA